MRTVTARLMKNLRRKKAQRLAPEKRHSVPGPEPESEPEPHLVQHLVRVEIEVSKEFSFATPRT
jgi:hypothetical protein